MQLASYRGPTRARLGWERLRADHAELLAHYRQTLERVRLDSGVVYRLQVGPLESESAAGQLCSLLRARDSDCLVVDPYGGLPAATSP